MTQALYRRYRPETFADVIGQEHVTGPLQQALKSDRVSHAYLFSGPRGCGKTTSARILARCLNCADGPTPQPCGVCDSCVALARGGPGHIDVIEIDAASHGGVDDARDLRDKAFFAPAQSRYKIYIVDEAHMVTSSGFNALLKIVEEPPPHLKFIFATTEPDRVIGTIRSRTHHYPFRLVPPSKLQDYLAAVCDAEKVPYEKGVLPLVVRTGAGSVRDSLSVLDQLIAGSGEEGLTYQRTVGLLGFTDAALLDDAVEAFAAADGAAVFSVVDRIIEAGHDPKRFTEDLLERVRDLIIVDAVPDAAASILADVPPDQLERIRSQAARFGSAELSRAADILSVGLTEMRGATAPRLHLELVCARVLLPTAHHDERSLHARLDRLERRIALGGMPAAGGVTPMTPPPPPAPAGGPAPAPAGGPGREPAPTPAGAAGAGTPAAVAASGAEVGPSAAAGDGEEAEPRPAPAAPGLDLRGVRGMWTEVLNRLYSLKRTTWALVSQNAGVAELAPGRITLSFASGGLRDTFSRGAHPELVRQALIDVLGLDADVHAIVDPSSGPGPDAPRDTAPRDPAPGATAPGATAPGATVPRATVPGGTVSQDTDPAAAREAARTVREAQRRVREAERPGRDRPSPGGGPTPPGPPGPPGPQGPRGARPFVPPDQDEPSVDDPDVDDAGLTEQQLLARELGATVIGEYPDE